MFRTLKGKISSVYLCLVLAIAIIGVVSMINLYGLSKAIDGLMTDNYKSINAVSYMLDALERQDNALLIYMSVDRQKGIDQFVDNNNIFLKWFNVESGNITEQGESAYINKIDDYYKQYVKSFSELQEIVSTGSERAASDYYDTQITPNFMNLKQELHNLSSLNEKAMFKGKDNATNNAQQSTIIILVLTAFTVISGFFLSRFSTNRFLRPIYSLTQAFKLVKAGQLDRQITINSRDEVGVLSIEFNNMTKRLQQFEQSTLGKLMEEKSKSIAIVKSISDPLIVLDTNFKIILLNNACEKFFNIEEDQIINKHFLEVIRNGELFDHISSVLNANEEFKEKIVHMNSEDDLYFNVVVTTMKDADSNIIGLIAAFQNVTQLKKLEKVKTDFIATISHEFKTPLASIIMGTSMMIEEKLGGLNDEQRSIMDTIKEDEIRLSNLVNDLLILSKIESDRAIFKIEPCSIGDIIEASVKQFYEPVQQKDITLYYAAEDNMPRVYADFEKITWVINNLIANAIKYTNAGDEIFVNALIRENKMFVSVKDTGMGIPPEYIDKIFDRFVQIKGPDSEVRGTGLGLVIVKELIQAHKGEIWCESKLDVGSKFEFTLPLWEGDLE